MQPCSCEINAYKHHHKIFFIVLFILAIAIGNALAGWFISRGIAQFRSSDRYVTVKGVAEKTVKADMAIWDIGYKLTGDDLALLTTQSLDNQKNIIDFLMQKGFSKEEIQPQATTVLDQFAREYGDSKTPHRYIITGTITLRTDKVDLLMQAGQASAELIQKGIILANKNDYGPNPRYLFTKLEELRPAMLQQATKSARLVAEQFAADSGSHVGAIRHASQGVFQIMSTNSNAGESYGADTDQAGSINKVIRVVSSIDYTLTD
jgi:uncharacterized protein